MPSSLRKYDVRERVVAVSQAIQTYGFGVSFRRDVAWGA
jgi:hypothetical protein